MGIPIVSEIWTGILWVIDFFINKAPKPLKFIIFLFLLLVVTSVLSFSLHIFGIHCNADSEPVKVDVTKFASNIGIFWATDKEEFIRGDNLTICQVHPEFCGKEHECYEFVKRLDNGHYQTCNETNTSSSCRYYLNDGICHTCTQTEICLQENIAWIFCGHWDDVCIDDAYYKEPSKLEFLNNCDSTCFVPTNYKWDVMTGRYRCLNETLCGLNAVKVIPRIDEKIDRAGGVLLYTGEDDEDYRKVIRVECSENLNPVLTFYGIPLFSYKVWVIFAVLYILVVVIIILKR